MLVGCDFEFILENVSQNFSKIDPVVDDAVLDGAAEFKDFILGLDFLSDWNIISLSRNYGLEGGSWHFVSWESYLTHSRSAVNDNCLTVLLHRFDKIIYLLNLVPFKWL